MSYKIFDSAILTNILFYFKDFILIVLFAIAVINIPTKLKILVILYFAIVGINFIIGLFSFGLGLMQLLQSTRNIIIMPLMICVGFGVSNYQDFRNKIIKVVFPIIVGCAMIGVVEYYADLVVGTKKFWTEMIGYSKYYLEIKHQKGNVYEGLPSNFYGSYGGAFFSVKRLVSVWANPLTSAYTMLIPALYYSIDSVGVLYQKKQKANKIVKIFCALILLVSIYLTHTRAIIIVLLIMLMAYTFIICRNNIPAFFLSCMGVLALFVKLDWTALKTFLYDGSTKGHVISVLTSIEKMKWTLFGNGIGYMGIYTSTATENAYLTLLGNIGVIGLILFLTIYLKAYRSTRQSLDNTFSITICLSAIAYAITGMVSEQLFAYTSIVLFYVLFGSEAKKNENCNRCKALKF